MGVTIYTGTMTSTDPGQNYATFTTAGQWIGFGGTTHSGDPYPTGAHTVTSASMVVNKIWSTVKNQQIGIYNQGSTYLGRILGDGLNTGYYWHTSGNTLLKGTYATAAASPYYNMGNYALWLGGEVSSTYYVEKWGTAVMRIEWTSQSGPTTTVPTLANAKLDDVTYVDLSSSLTKPTGTNVALSWTPSAGGNNNTIQRYYQATRTTEGDEAGGWSATTLLSNVGSLTAFGIVAPAAGTLIRYRIYAEGIKDAPGDGSDWLKFPKLYGAAANTEPKMTNLKADATDWGGVEDIPSNIILEKAVGTTVTLTWASLPGVGNPATRYYWQSQVNDGEFSATVQRFVAEGLSMVVNVPADGVTVAYRMFAWGEVSSTINDGGLWAYFPKIKGKAATSININTGGVWRKGEPYINTGGVWRKGEAHINAGGTWQKGG